MTPHPQRCETCNHHILQTLMKEPHLCDHPMISDNDEDMLHLITIDEFIRIGVMGCASHSSKTPAPAASEIKNCFDLKEYGESIRNQALDEVLKRLEKQGVEIHERNGQRYYVVEGTFNFASFMKWLESLRTQEHERK